MMNFALFAYLISIINIFWFWIILAISTVIYIPKK